MLPLRGNMLIQTVKILTCCKDYTTNVIKNPMLQYFFKENLKKLSTLNLV